MPLSKQVNQFVDVSDGMEDFRNDFHPDEVVSDMKNCSNQLLSKESLDLKQCFTPLLPTVLVNHQSLPKELSGMDQRPCQSLQNTDDCPIDKNSKEKLGLNYNESFPSELEDFCPIENLPNELLGTITQYLTHEELLNCSGVNSKWFDIVSEKLYRTESCSLVKDKESCEDFNSSDKVIQHLILRHAVHLCECFDRGRVSLLESFYVSSEKFSSKDVETLRQMLDPCLNLTKITLRIGRMVEISQLEALLADLSAVKRVCLIVDQLNEKERQDMLEFFKDVYYFYDEIIVQILSPYNEVIHICSDTDSLHDHIHGQYARVELDHVNPALVKDIIRQSQSKVKHLVIRGREHTDETLVTLSETELLEYLTLEEFNITNETWGVFFSNLNKHGQALKELNMSKCFNITNEDIATLNSLYLDRIDIDFSNCPKITNIKQFLTYCVSHVVQLKMTFIYNEVIIDNFLDVFQSLSEDRNLSVLKQLDVDILRINHCSEEISSQIQEFKLNLASLADKCSIDVHVGEIFSRISQNS
uniref:F-box domain-containing protein n=1 Tax=Cacopsylla melanoneura TaxID=428564 RepID=A0A8D8Q7H7_9HEMI